MWVRLLVLGALASCYSPHAQPGAPCSPEAPVCPDGQHCALVAGSYVCTDGSGSAPADAPPADAVDAPVPIDARIDASAPIPWTLVQTTESQTATVNLAATGANHTIVVAIETNATAAVAAVTDSAGNTYTQLPNAHAINTAVGLGVELWYARGTVAGATKVTILAPVVRAVVAWEIAGLRATGAIDAVTTLDDQPASTTPAGAPITTTARGDFVISVAIVDNVISGLHAGSEFTNDHTVLGNGWAHLTSATSAPGPHQARWDQGTAGGSCAVSAALFAAP